MTYTENVDSRWTRIVVPDLGAEDHAVEVCRWLVEVGDEVSEGERVVELLCCGTLVHVVSPATGILSQVLAAKQSIVETGQVLGEVAANCCD